MTKVSAEVQLAINEALHESEEKARAERKLLVKEVAETIDPLTKLINDQGVTLLRLSDERRRDGHRLKRLEDPSRDSGVMTVLPAETPTKMTLLSMDLKNKIYVAIITTVPVMFAALMAWLSKPSAV